MRITLLLGCIFLFLSTHTFAQDQIIGKWLSEDKQGIIEIYKQYGKYYGKLVWLKKSYNEKGLPMPDINNTDKTLRNRTLVGLVILNDFYYINNKWQEGTLYDPELGRTFKCKIWMTDNNTLNVRGYWGILSEVDVWTRVK